MQSRRGDYVLQRLLTSIRDRVKQLAPQQISLKSMRTERRRKQLQRHRERLKLPRKGRTPQHARPGVG